MFEGSQNFPGSRGRYFEGNVIRINLIIVKQTVCKGMLRCKFVNKGYPRKPRILLPTKYGESTVFHSEYLL